MKFNEKLVLLRKKHGYSQEKLAELLGVSRQAISRWELGDTTPEMEHIVSLCEIFHVRADDLIHDNVQENMDNPSIELNKTNTQTTRNDKNHYHLFAAIGFSIGAICWLMSIISSNNDIQLALSCFNETVLLGLAINQYVLYFKKR